MNPSIKSINTMATPAVLPGVAGKISMVWPPLDRTSPRMQNFCITDEETSDEVRVMLIGHPIVLDDRHRGGYIEISSTEADSVMFKAQKSRDQRPQPNKIEVKPAARIVRLLRADEYHGPLSRHQASAAPAVRTSDQPAPPPQESIPDAPPTAPVRSVAQRVWALGAVYRMCAESAAWAVSLEGKGDPAVERINSATQTIFIQATRDGLHHQLEPGAFFREHSPEIAQRFFKEEDRPKTAVDRLLAAIPENARTRALEVLVATGKLKKGCALTDISEADAQLCLDSGILRLLDATAA